MAAVKQMSWLRDLPSGLLVLRVHSTQSPTQCSIKAHALPLVTAVQGYDQIGRQAGYVNGRMHVSWKLLSSFPQIEREVINHVIHPFFKKVNLNHVSSLRFFLWKQWPIIILK